jgi:lysophospholipase L1-like esterase
MRIFLIVLFVATLTLLGLLAKNFFQTPTQLKQISNSLPTLLPTPSPSPTPNPFDYTLVFVGDSLTQYLGNFDELKDYLNKAIPNKTFLMLNYGFGATNILSVPERIEKETQYGRTFQPINNIDFDLIFIESFGHNPLSQFPLEEGLKKQTEALDQIVESITKKHPKESIVFVATIAPNRDNYAKGAVDLSTQKRREWADERIAYIKNHIEYAKLHNIPVVNIFEKSMLQGTGQLKYINQADGIHPSPTGIYLISQEIANFIKTSNLLH